MKPTDNNYRKYCRYKVSLINFLNRQSKTMTKDWTHEDHCSLVMETTVYQLQTIGLTDDEIRAELNAILISIDNNNHKPKLH